MKFPNKIITHKDIEPIDSAFLQFLQSHNGNLHAQILKHRLDNTELPSETLIKASKYLEDFLYRFFGITNPALQFDEKLPWVKRNFVQRCVFIKYKEKEIDSSWENSYRFTTEKQFIDDILTENKDILTKIELFTAFVLFTDSGNKKYGHHEVFRLPQPLEKRSDLFTNTNNAISAKTKSTRQGFNLTDTPPSKHAIDWNIYYCLYCHNRGKDSCSKGLDDKKTGCPLKQDISEPIYLKREGFTIAPLAVIMRKNPLCIITGRRICNDCELACIFQKQEAVDIQSIETRILNDVLHLEYGLEIYHLLLMWNPVNTTSLPQINGKTVGIAGSGPSGLFAAYLFEKQGGTVLVFDALNIEIPQKILDIKNNIVTDICPLLNQKLEERHPSGIGGVIEYGITVRWNKNYLDLLIGLLLRRNITFIGSIRIGGLLNYSDIFAKFKLNHFALCVGSARPQLPLDLPNLFTAHKLTEGIMTASDFLMSLHINRNSRDLQKFRQKSVYILGCGLTAIDTACEIRALLLKNGIPNPSVQIIYYKEFDKSSAYKTNFLEFKKATEEGIIILQNTEIIKIHKSSNKISALETKTGEILQCDLLIIAIGTKPNTEHITDFIDKPATSFFGDCNPLYTGSVVKALSSVQKGIEHALSQTLANQNVAWNNIPEYLQKTVTGIKKISLKNEEAYSGIHDINEIQITSPVLYEKAQTGNVLKLQVMYNNSIAITVTRKKSGKLYGYLFNSNAETQNLIDSFFSGKTIHVNGINCTNTPKINKETTIIASSKTAFILKEIFPHNTIILANNFIIDKHGPSTNYLIAVENFALLQAIEEKLSGTDYDVILYQKMNCMLGGICGRCSAKNGHYKCR